jgi:Cu-processing system ATP-binding protein
MEPPVTNTVELGGVSKRYDSVQAVRDVSLALPAGETIALVGHNGAGKTTLLKLMLGLIHPSAGTIRVLGENPAAGEFAARRRLGYLPENVAFNAALTGREILSFYARLKREPVRRSLDLLDRVGLGTAASRRVGTYSKGMRQRLGLAQALLGEPAVLLLDEPTSGLDPALRLSFYAIVQQLRDRGATVVLSSHALTEIEERADRVVIMNGGVMAAYGSIDELRRIARLPTRIRLSFAPGGAEAARAWLAPADSWRQINGHRVEIDAAPEQKIALLRRATEQGTPIRDVDVVPPTLDELYAHFLRSQEATP